MTKLTIAIPTYNRDKYLYYNLINIVAQLNYRNISDVEILVVDNDSSDNTQSCVEEFRHCRVRYIKNDHNIGSSANFVKALQETKGDYVWLLGDDDVVCWKGIDRILEATKDNPAVIFTEFAQGEHKNPKIKICDKSVGYEKDFLLNQEDAKSLFSVSFTKIFNLVSISSMIVRRDCINFDLMKEKTNTCFPHAYMFIDAMTKGSIRIISDPVWIWRSNLERVKEGDLHDDEPQSMWDYIAYAKEIGFMFPEDYLVVKTTEDKKGKMYKWLKKNNLLGVAKCFYRIPRLIKYYIQRQ